MKNNIDSARVWLPDCEPQLPVNNYALALPVSVRLPLKKSQLTAGERIRHRLARAALRFFLPALFSTKESDSVIGLIVVRQSKVQANGGMTRIRLERLSDEPPQLTFVSRIIRSRRERCFINSE